MKLAIIILTDHLTAESMGRVSNAFYIAAEALSHGETVEISFNGAGTRWLAELDKPDHKLHDIYTEIKPAIIGACLMCATAFGVDEKVKAAGFKLTDEYRGHTSVYRWMKEGFTILTF